MRAPFAADLENRVFAFSDPAAAGLRPLSITELDPLLRGLLLTDGTVTRALEAQLLESVAVEVVEQSRVAIPAAPAAWLGLPSGGDSVRRRVAMTSGPDRSPVAHAESYVVADRLPPDFLGTLSASAKGIGESLHRAHLESRRELLAFGLGEAAEWTGPGGGAVLVRLYRLITAGRPAMLISERFLVGRARGGYRLRSLIGRPLRGRRITVVSGSTR